MIEGDTFRFFVPATALKLEKSGEQSKDGKRWIQGIASTDNRDLQGEVVEQGGIDFSYFLKHGYFNDDHKPGPENKVGQPTECKVTHNGLWVKGFLFKNHKKADEYWELMRALESSDASRKVGFSIQGKVKRREGSKLLSCWIQDVALTPAPVNTTTWAEIAKSLSSVQMDLEKEADEDKSEKAVTAAGNPTVPESLDSDEKLDRTSKSLSYEDAVVFLETEHGLPKEAAAAVADVIFDLF